MSLRLVAWIFATLGAVTAHAQTSIALPGDRVFPENIAASRDGTLYVGSVGQGGVFRIAPHSIARGSLSPFQELRTCRVAT